MGIRPDRQRARPLLWIVVYCAAILDAGLFLHGRSLEERKVDRERASLLRAAADEPHPERRSPRSAPAPRSPRADLLGSVGPSFD
jgi:hypothetical protein